jgi:hypothetical protein
VNRRLALLATFFRLIETTILIVAALNDFYVLRLLSGASYLTTVNSDELAALAPCDSSGFPHGRTGPSETGRTLSLTVYVSNWGTHAGQT